MLNSPKTIFMTSQALGIHKYTDSNDCNVVPAETWEDKSLPPENSLGGSAIGIMTEADPAHSTCLLNDAWGNPFITFTPQVFIG